MTSPPTSRVEAPHDVCHPCTDSPVSDWNSIPNAREKFCPSSWLVPIWSALPSDIMASQVHVVVAPAKRSRSVLRPISTGTARTSTMKSR